MPIHDDLKEFFSEEPPAVIVDADKFRMRLQIGSGAFAYLKKTENLGDFLTVIGGGGLASAGAATAWFSSLGVLGQMGLAVGVVSNPVGWVALAGAGGAVAVYGARKFFRKAREHAVEEVPKFINSPIDVLGQSIFGLFCPVLLKMAYADGACDSCERELIREFFMDWGYGEAFLDENIPLIEKELDQFEFDKLSEHLKQLEESGDIQYSTMVEQIVAVAEKVVQADGELHDAEQEVLDKLVGALNDGDASKKDEHVIGRWIRSSLDVNGDGVVNEKDWEVAKGVFVKTISASAIAAGVTAAGAAAAGSALVSSSATAIGAAASTAAGTVIGVVTGQLAATAYSAIKVAQVSKAATVIASEYAASMYVSGYSFSSALAIGQAVKIAAFRQIAIAISPSVTSTIAAIKSASVGTGAAVGFVSEIAAGKIAGLPIVQAVATEALVMQGKVFVVGGIAFSVQAAIAIGLISAVIVGGYTYFILNSEKSLDVVYADGSPDVEIVADPVSSVMVNTDRE